jgi:hypothetical protein
LGRTYDLENLCVTDVHDLDLTIFTTSALDRYLAEHADQDLMKREFKSNVPALRERLLGAALPVAYCRFVSEDRGLRLYFKDLAHEEFVKVDDMSTDEDALVRDVVARSATKCTVADLKRYVASESAKAHDLYQLANGHDVAAMLGIALRKLIGHRKLPQTWASEVEAGLRLAFDWEALVGTGLYQILRGWEAEQKRYKIFKEQPT